jgi:dTDP-4-dehydrorhamnose reductase
MARIRIAVTGSQGQIARSLIECASASDVEVVTLARPALDLAAPRTIEPAIDASGADILVSAAAYTDVNRAESEPDVADLINAKAPGLLATHARRLGIPIIHLSSDYVFDGQKPMPYIESDSVHPLNVYGRSKAKGEQAIAKAHPLHVILRACWVYSPFSRNFVRTMLGLAERQKDVRIVADQVGNPTSAADIAEGIVAVARHLIEGHGKERYGIFHMASADTASWAEFATEIFSVAAAKGRPAPRVLPISSTQYQTAAMRPLNSRLNCVKIARVYGVSLPDWRASLRPCIEKILDPAA